MPRSQLPARWPRCVLALAAGALPLAACLPGDLIPDAGDVGPVGPVDVGELDASGTSPPDAWTPGVIVMFDDGGLDANAPAPDAPFSCESCAPAPDCQTLNCFDESCVYDPVDDGELCGPMGASVCVEGMCLARVCGDGWREDGTAGVAVEGCDDGNLIDGDGCDAMCLPEVRVIDERVASGIHASVGAAAAGMDDAGNLLVTWLVDLPGADPTENVALLAQRFDRRGVADEVLTELERGPSTNPPIAGVIPLSSGWALAWPSTTVDELGIAYVVASPTGAFATPRCAHAPTAHPEAEPTLARIDDGFVIGWSVRLGLELHVRARRFDPTGIPLGPELLVTAADATSESLPFIAGRADYASEPGMDANRWTAAYFEGSSGGRVLFQSFDGDAPLGAAVQRVFHLPLDLVVVPDTDGLVVGTQTAAERGTVRAAWLDDAVTYTDDTPFATLPLPGAAGRAIDEDLAVAPVDDGGPGGDWLALWRSSNTADRPMGMASSAAALPASLARVQADLETAWEVQDLSLGRAGPRLSDGWVLTYISITDTTYRLNVFHITPDAMGAM